MAEDDTLERINQTFGLKPAGAPTLAEPQQQAAPPPDDDTLTRINATFGIGGAKPAAGKAPEPAASPAESSNVLDRINATFGLGGAPPAGPSPGEKQAENDLSPWGDRVAQRFKDAWNTPGVAGKTWDILNVPLFSAQDFEKWVDPLIGSPTQAGGLLGGITRGAYELAGGLTSPLSLAFVLGTGGLGGLIDSGGEALLKSAGGMGAAEIAEVVKGSELLATARKTGRLANEAWAEMASEGVNPDTVKKGLDVLSKGGMTSHDLLKGGLIRTVGSAGLRNIGLSVATAEKVAKGAQILIDGGFAASNVYGAATAFPSVLDALKEGNTDEAARLITVAAGTAGFGLLGTRATLKEAGYLMDDLAAKSGLRTVPSDTNKQLSRNVGIADRQMIEAGRAHELKVEEWRKKYKEIDTPQDHKLVREFVESGQDEDVMRRNHDLVAESADRPERIGVPALALAPDVAAGKSEIAGSTWHSPEEAQRIFKELQDKYGEEVPIRVLRGASFHDPVAKFVYDPEAGTKMNAEEFKRVYEREQKEDARLFDMSRKSGSLVKDVAGTPAEGVKTAEPTVKPPIAVSIAEKRGALQDSIKDDQGNLTAGLYKNDRGEVTLQLAGKSLDAFNRAAGNQLSSQYSGLSTMTKEGLVTLDIVKNFIKSGDPEIEQLGRMLLPVRNEPLSIVRMTSPTPAQTMLHEHVHGILDPGEVRLVNEAIKNLPGYDAVVKHIQDLRPAAALLELGLSEPSARYRTTPEIVNEVLPRIFDGRLFGEEVASNKDMLNLAWEALNTIGEQVGQKKYELALGNLEPELRNELYAHLQQTGRGISEEVRPGEAGANAPQAEPGAGPTEQRPGGVRGGDETALQPQARLTPDIAGETGEDRLKELAARKLIKEKYTDKEIDEMLWSMNPKNLKDSHRALAKELHGYFTSTFERAHEAGALPHGLENYITHMWAKDADNPAANRVLAEARSGRYAQNTSMARKRVFDHTIEGQLLGKKLAVHDPIALAAHNANTFDRIIAARKMMERLLDTNLRGSDGRPLAVVPGSGKVLQDEQGNNSAILTHPDRVRSVRISDKVLDGLRKSGDLDRLLKEGKIIKYGGEAEPLERGPEPRDVREHYAWDHGDYQSIDHPATRDWGFAVNDTQGVPVHVQTHLKFHPEAVDYMKRQLETQSPVVKALKPIFTAGREAKGIMLSFDAFHLAQEGLRALMTGVSPLGMEKWDLRTNPTLGKLVEHGLTLKDYSDGVDSFQEGQMVGHSHLMSRVPGIGPASAWFQNFLFRKYVPSLKARASEHLFERYSKLYPERGEARNLEAAAKDTNERFGGLNLRREGRALATQDVFRLAALAPDWLESEMRSIGRAMGGDGRVLRRDLAKMTVAMWLTARVLNQLNTGSSHFEAPFGVVYKDDEGREKVVSLRTLPTDMLHAINDPVQFMRYRTSPLMRTASELTTGRDSMGRRLPTRDLVFDIAGDVMPLPVQNVARKMTGFSTDQNYGDIALRSVGGQVTQYKTQAAQKAAELSADRSESGPVDPSKIRQHTMKLEIEDRLRAGTFSNQDLINSVDQGLISPKDAKDMRTRVSETQGMDTNTAKLYLRASKLPVEDFLLVWDEATQGEKKAMGRLMQKKRMNYFRKVMSEMTPVQRQNDPTYNRLRRMFPNESPF